ncbi:AEC family transporter [uncultured Vibrio sp.]|uniref:AEC family transporter n=1 Tax=uncultured Vibrio sp. TaxID=114054 RepID=UPI0025FDAF86|nr:AEC family transporter [uncultured Vibrio sp.]
MLVESLYQVVMTILPVFIVIGIGYMAAKRNVLPENGHKALAAFVFNFGLPAAIFSALSSKSLDEIWHADYIVLYTLGSLLAFIIVAMVSAFLLRRNLTESVVLGLGGSFSNSLLIGFPIIYFLFGTQALVPFSLTLIVENLIMLPLLLTLADLSSNSAKLNLKKRFVQTSQNLARNPIIIAIVFGMLVSALSIPTPEAATRIIEILSNSVTGVALFTIGGGLVGVRVTGMKKEISLVMLTKLVIHPLILLVLLISWFEMDSTMSAVAVILASMPMFGVYAVIGQKYNMGGLCSAVLLPTTVLAMVTVSMVTTLSIMIF